MRLIAAGLILTAGLSAEERYERGKTGNATLGQDLTVQVALHPEPTHLSERRDWACAATDITTASGLWTVFDRSRQILYINGQRDSAKPNDVILWHCAPRKYFETPPSKRK